MIGRAFVETLLALVLTFVLVVIAMFVLDIVDGKDPLTALMDGLQSVGTLMIIPLVVTGIGWLITNIAARQASSARRFWVNLAILFVVALLTAGVSFILFGLVIGGFAALLVVVAVVAAAAMFIAGVLALVLVHFVFFRRGSSKPEVMQVQLAPNP